MVSSKLKLILASASPRRKELLSHLKIPFEVITANVSEHSSALDPVDFCRDIATSKGSAVFAKLRDKGRNSLYVVSADTIVCLEGEIFEKPSGREEARRFLKRLSGKTHSVYTAVVIHFGHEDKEQSYSFVERSKVTFNSISDPLMERYLDTGDSLDKAGAYGIQGPSLTFISKVEGDYANVVGFPLSRFVTETERFLVSHFPDEDIWFNLF